MTSDLDLLLCPLVQIDRLDLGDVDPEVSMDTSAADTDEDAQIPGRPSWTWNRERKVVINIWGRRSTKKRDREWM